MGENIMKEIIYKRFGVVKIFIVIKGVDKYYQEKSLNFILPLYFSQEHINKIEKEWSKITKTKNRPELIPLSSMQELSSLLPRVELMYINDYVKANFAVSQIEKFVKNISIDRFNWELSSDDKN